MTIKFNHQYVVMVYEPRLSNKWADVSKWHSDHKLAIDEMHWLSMKHPECIFRVSNTSAQHPADRENTKYEIGGQAYIPFTEDPYHPRPYEASVAANIDSKFHQIHHPMTIYADYWLSPDNTTKPPYWHYSDLLLDVSTEPLARFILQTSEGARELDNHGIPRIYKVCYGDQTTGKETVEYWSGGSRMTTPFALSLTRADEDRYLATTSAVIANPAEHNIHHFARHLSTTSVAPMQDLFARIGIEIGTIISQGNLTDEQKVLLADVNRYVEKIINTLGQDS